MTEWFCYVRFKDNCPRGKLFPDPKTNPNPNPDRGEIFLRGKILFYKKVRIKAEQKEGCSCNLYIARKEEFQFI